MDMPHLTLQLSYKLDNYDSIRWFLDAIRPLFPEQTTEKQTSFLNSKSSNYEFSIQDNYVINKSYKGTKDFLNAIFRNERVNLVDMKISNNEHNVFLALFAPSVLLLFANEIPTLEDYERQLKSVLTLDLQDNQQHKEIQSVLFGEKELKDVENVIIPKILDEKVVVVINERLTEIKKAVRNRMPLSATFLIGSTLEGVLSALAQKYPREFNTAHSAPKRDGKVLPLTSWQLSGLIDVAHEINVFGKDVKDFSEKVRDFRNYIHPNEQVKQNFSPTMDTVNISLHVFKIALNQINAFIKHKSDG